MPHFEILVPGPGPDGLRMTFHVEADNWMAALHIALEELGQPWGLQDALCELQGEGHVRISDPSRERIVEIHEVGPGEVSVAAARPETEGARALEINRPPTRGGPARRGTEPYVLPAEGDHPPMDRPPLPEVSPATPRPGVRATHRGMPVGGLVRGAPGDPQAAGTDLATACAALDDPRMNAEQLIDAALDLAWTHLQAGWIQCMLPEDDGEAWRVVAARGERANAVVLTRIVFDQPPLSSWAPHLDRALHVEAPGLHLHYDKRGERQASLEARQVLMIPVRRGERRLAMLLLGHGTGGPCFERDRIEAARDLGDRLARALASRL